jgi:hypothetical protein
MDDVLIMDVMIKPHIIVGFVMNIGVFIISHIDMEIIVNSEIVELL